MVINDLSHHSKQVTSLEWHPFKEQILASAGEDGKVFVWDNSKCGEEQARKDYEDGPPELIFPHMNHSSLIEDICWKPDADRELLPCIASVENELIMQVWKPIDDFFTEEIDMMPYADRIADEDLE